MIFGLELRLGLSKSVCAFLHCSVGIGVHFCTFRGYVMQFCKKHLVVWEIWCIFASMLEPFLEKRVGSISSEIVGAIERSGPGLDWVDDVARKICIRDVYVVIYRYGWDEEVIKYVCETMSSAEKLRDKLYDKRNPRRNNVFKVFIRKYRLL